MVWSKEISALPCSSVSLLTFTAGSVAKYGNISNKCSNKVEIGRFDCNWNDEHSGVSFLAISNIFEKLRNLFFERVPIGRRYMHQ